MTLTEFWEESVTKIGKTLDEILIEQRELWNDFLKYKWAIFYRSRISFVLFLICLIVYYLYIMPPNNLDNKISWFIFLIFVIAMLYIFIIEEVLFIKSFFNLEKNYYKWKESKNDVSGRTGWTFHFQESLDNFQLKLLSKTSGFKRNSIPHRRDIFNFRTAKVKKEIDIYFNVMTDLLLSMEFFEKNTEHKFEHIENDFENYLEKFKNGFIVNPNSLNPIALDSFFETFDKSLEIKYPVPYTDNKKIVDEYYDKIEKLVEQRAERRFELIRSIIAMVITIVLAIVAYLLIEAFSRFS